MRYNNEKVQGERFRAGYVRLREGKNPVRILPPCTAAFEKELDYIAYKYFQHYGVEIGGEVKSLICRKTLGKQETCPVCDMAADLKKTGGVEGEALAKKLRASPKWLFNVLAKDDDGNWQMMILDCGPMIYDEIMNYVTDERYDASDPEKGRDLVIEKTSKGNARYQVEYSVRPEPEASSCKDRLPEDWEKRLDALQANVKSPLSVEDLTRLLSGHDVVSEAAKAALSSESAASAPKAEEPAAEEPEEEMPSCFGEGFTAGDEKCMACKHRPKCIKVLMDKANADG